jgi:hypothetical protein
MKQVCRAACCSELPKSLPEKIAFLGIPLCERHSQHILALVEDAPTEQAKLVALVEARRLVFPEGDAPLVVLAGGRS